jgi:hypothetical protein
MWRHGGGRWSVAGGVAGSAGVGGGVRGGGGSAVSIGEVARTPWCVGVDDGGAAQMRESDGWRNEHLRDDRRKIGPARGLAFSTCARCASFRKT